MPTLPISAPLRPVADTWSGAMASQRPAKALEHYETLAEQVWLSPLVREQADPVLESVGEGRVAWCSLSGPYGWGKTATSVAIWKHASAQGFWAVPPLSCTHFDEMARALVAMLGEMHPQHKAKLEKIYREVWDRNLTAMSRRDAEKYEVEAPVLKRLLDDKARQGELTFDSNPHRFVELLARIGELAARNGRGLVVVLDELQQLLGALDARSTVSFREFVWGIRTENAPVAVFLSLDSLLEARLGQWASDVLHRIREHGPVINLRDVYTREFPQWLWQHIAPEGEELTLAVLDSLGQYVERSDLASGPRTVVDVFARARDHYALKGRPYDILDLVSDVRDGALRYFGEGAPVQRILREIEADPWIASDPNRRRFVATLAAFPSGIAPETLERYFPDDEARETLRAEMFGPLLVPSKHGLALEALSRVRRNEWGWESVVARAFDGLPALDVLASHAPTLVERTLVPMLFNAEAGWKLQQQDAFYAQSEERQGAWSLWQGSFAAEFPERRVALWLGNEQPDFWPNDVDVSLALVCLAEVEAETRCELDEEKSRATFYLPVLRPLPKVPQNLAGQAKHLEPEPFRAASLLVAASELDAMFALEAAPQGQFRAESGRAWAKEALQWSASEILGGTLRFALPADGKKAATSFSHTLRGLDVLRGAFTLLCHARFAGYQTLQNGGKWRASLDKLGHALEHPSLDAAQRSGARAIEGAKSEIVARLWGENSTAAFDSLARNLGPFIQTSGDAGHWRLLLPLPLHPLEDLILDAARASGNGIDVKAATEWGTRAGYLRAEVEIALELLQKRELLDKRSSARWFATAKRASQRETAQEAEVAALQEQLKGLELESWFADEVNFAARPALQARLQAPLQGELAERLATLRDQRLAVVEWSRDEKSALEEMMYQGLGELRTFGGADFEDSSFAIHLNGLARRLAVAFEGAQGEGRNLVGKMEGLGDARDENDLAWAQSWARGRGSLIAATRSWRDKQARLLESSALLDEWKGASARETQVRARVESARDYASGLAAQWDRFTSKWKQTFALDDWKPLERAGDFEAELSPIEAALRNKEWAWMQGLLAAKRDLREQFGPLLRSNAPEFCASTSQEAMERDFAGLWQWTLAEFDHVLERAARLKERGHAWRHPTNERKKWDDLWAEIEGLKPVAQRTLKRETIWELGNRTLALWRGFEAQVMATEEICGTHGAAATGHLDFDRLALLLERGLISITVEVASGTASEPSSENAKK